ncbi:hypothetical protein ARAM_000213 [Aspergillus rambellii]|uniref:Uncharacterized protein n=1 Tax=Aspergillus rambellii TaxID=308745 RepID=A0A0F8WRV7_9EURO|nr:hypothetical protein ARAM_000213 [Aspergillus rambellii]
MSGFSVRRPWSFRSLSSSSPPTQPHPPVCRRQDAAGHYLTRTKLQAFLAQRFPRHPRLDFHIRLYEDVWSFDAPEEVTEAELE